jgi:hypothetical protein
MIYMSGKFVKCRCQHCNKNIEFDSDQIEVTGSFGGQLTGQNITCPHCGMDTILFVQQIEMPAPNQFAPKSSSNFQSCPTCQNQVSVTANSCPKCGHMFKYAGGINLKDPVHIVGLLICAAIIVLVTIYILSVV